MVEQLIEKAKVLIEALPYITKFHGKTVVVKYGGSVMTADTLKKNVAQDVVLMKFVGMHPVIVHGGGPEITRVMKKMGKESVFHRGLRVTDEETKDIVEMVLVGRINLEVVNLINRAGGTAVGLSGKDGSLIAATKYNPESFPGDESVDIGYVGQVKEIRPEIIRTLDEKGYIPVISPIGVGEDGETLNINADSVAGEIAAALKAEKLVLLTDTLGIMRDPNEERTLFSSLTLSEVDELVAQGVVEGGMLPKVEACRHALQAGVASVHIISGSILHSLLLEIFTDAGIGTKVLI